MTDYNREWKKRKWGDMIKYSPAPRHRRNIVINLLEKYRQNHRTLLDIGCGNGWMLYHIGKKFPDIRLAGTDVALSVIEQGRSVLPGIRMYPQDIGGFLTISETFDIITCMEVLEHVENFQMAMSNIRSLLNPDGLVMITVPGGKIYPIDKMVGHIRHFRDASVFEKHGFQVIEKIHWGFPFFNIYKILINIFPEKINREFCDCEYGSGKKFISDFIYLLFFLNINFFGNQLILVLKKI